MFNFDAVDTINLFLARIDRFLDLFERLVERVENLDVEILDDD